MKSILDPSFRYVNSRNTDIRKTFARIRRQQQVSAFSTPSLEGRKTLVVSLNDQRKAVA